MYLLDNRSTIMDDSFIRSYIGELLRSLRTQYLIDLIKPYSRLELSFLARVRQLSPSIGRALDSNFTLQQLNVDKEEVEELLIELILEGKVEGKIDQVAMRLELDRKFVSCLSSSFAFLYLLIRLFLRQTLEKSRYGALDKWREALESTHSAVIGKNTPSMGRSMDYPEHMSFPGPLAATFDRF